MANVSTLYIIIDYLEKTKCICRSYRTAAMLAKAFMLRNNDDDYTHYITKAVFIDDEPDPVTWSGESIYDPTNGGSNSDD